MVYINKMTHSEAGKLGQIRKQQVLVERYEASPTFCHHCNEKLDYKKRHNKFCNKSCSAQHNNLGVCRNPRKRPLTLNRDKKGRRVCECELCLKPISYNGTCCFECSNIKKWLKIKNEIELTGIAPYKVTAKRYITEKYGCQCSQCGLSEWRGDRLGLILDHMNGNPYDWNITNLRLLCPNCDSQTPTFKGRNKGNGRHTRRERYKEGKSY